MNPKIISFNISAPVKSTLYNSIIYKRPTNPNKLTLSLYRRRAPMNINLIITVSVLSCPHTKYKATDRVPSYRTGETIFFNCNADKKSQYQSKLTDIFNGKFSDLAAI